MASLAGIAITILVLTFSVESGARDLRPSDHGLEFQTLAPTGLNYPPGMKSFFNGKNSWSTSDVALPRATNSSDASSSMWWRTAGTGGGGEDNVKNAIMVASLVCGITGVIILVASGLLCLFKHRKRKLNESSCDNNNKLQLVVRNP